MKMANEFQIRAVNAALPVLKAFGIDALFSEAGESERFLYFSYPAMELQIWIYDDEVAFWLGEFRLQCENQDFDGPDEMITFWISAIGEKLALNHKKNE